MFWAPRRRRERLAGIESEADRLIALRGEDACATAHRMQREANDFATMRYWIAVQTIIVRKTGQGEAYNPARQVMIFERPHDRGFDVLAHDEGRVSPFRRVFGGWKAAEAPQAKDDPETADECHAADEAGSILARTQGPRRIDDRADESAPAAARPV